MLALTVAVAHEAYQMAYRDELTGLLGRRALNGRLQRLGRRYVLAMVDVDHFKRLNDRQGHDIGDHMLRMIAAHLRWVDGGKAYRYGGQEIHAGLSRSRPGCLPRVPRSAAPTGAIGCTRETAIPVRRATNRADPCAAA